MEKSPNYKSGKYSTVLKGAVGKFRRLLKRPVKVLLALYPEGLRETLSKPPQERYFVTIQFPTDLPDLPAQERILVAARRELTGRQVYVAQGRSCRLAV